jgi:multisubunit Na+/H+ antiporter MnhF subunit
VEEATVLSYVIYTALATHAVLIGVALLRVWRGENVIDRLVAVEMLGTLTLAVFVLIALLTRSSRYVDVALALAVLGYVGTIALAQYVADEQVY